MSDYAEHLIRAKAEIHKAEEQGALQNWNQTWTYLLRASQRLQEARDALDLIRAKS